MKTRSLIATAVAASALAAPAAATAADLYVQSGAGVTTCAQDDPCSLAQAVAVADIVSNRDSIHIVGPFSSTQAVDLTHSPIDLIGSGRGAGGTVFSGHDAQIKIGADSSATGFALTADSCAVRITAGGTLRDASLSSPSCGIDVDAAGAGASLIDNVDVDGGAGTGINVHGSISGEETTIRGSDVRAHVGINVSTTTGFTLERSTVESDHTAVAVAHASAAISNSLLRVVATGGRGVDAYGSIVAVDATTIDGTGLGAEGVYGDPAGGAQVTVAGSIVRNFTHDLTAAAPVAILFVSSSDFGTTSGDRLIARGGNINADPHWRNAAAGDYRPTPDSPVIDKGVAGPAATGETDRAGKSRVEDGDHDGTATRDIGAFEYQPSEPEPRAGADRRRQRPDDKRPAAAGAGSWRRSAAGRRRRSAARGDAAAAARAGSAGAGDDRCAEAHARRQQAEARQARPRQRERRLQREPVRREAHRRERQARPDDRERPSGDSEGPPVARLPEEAPRPPRHDPRHGDRRARPPGKRCQDVHRSVLVDHAKRMAVRARSDVRSKPWGPGRHIRRLALALTAAALVVFSGVLVATAATRVKAPTPKEIKLACAQKGGTLAYVARARQCRTKNGLVKIQPGPVDVCIRKSGRLAGRVRRTTDLALCKTRTERALQLPDTKQQWFCVARKGRTLRWTSRKPHCPAKREFPAFVKARARQNGSPQNAPPQGVADTRDDQRGRRHHDQRPGQRHRCRPRRPQHRVDRHECDDRGRPRERRRNDHLRPVGPVRPPRAGPIRDRQLQLHRQGFARRAVGGDARRRHDRRANDATRLVASDGAAAFTENGAPAAVDPNLELTDADDSNLAGATVSITTGRLPSDALAFDDQNGITGSYDAGTGVLTLSGTATIADYRTALRSVRFTSPSDDPGTQRTIEFRGAATAGPPPRRSRSPRSTIRRSSRVPRAPR